MPTRNTNQPLQEQDIVLNFNASRSMDLTTEPGLQSFLALAYDSKFSASRVTKLVGVHSNHTYRIYLDNPYDGIHRTAVVKHALDLRVGPFQLTVVRLVVEAKTMAAVGTHLGSSIVTTPKIFHFDSENSVLVMEDCGDTSFNVKELFLSESVPVERAKEMGRHLGSFLARLHAIGSTTNVNDVRSELDIPSNAQARPLSAAVSYGRLRSTLTNTATDAPPFDPPLNLPDATLQIVDAVVQRRMQDIEESEEIALTHGDFWTGNVLVRFTQDSPTSEGKLDKMLVVDWELSKPGLAGLDIGQFVAEMVLIARYHPSKTEAANAFISAFLQEYRKTSVLSEQALIQVARVATTHVGTHLVAWPPRTPTWQDAEKLRGVVLEAVELLEGGWSGTEEWLRRSFMAPLLG
ncbi:kinase-like domain-containing protein [Crassisporium funariophilum]|nr:kinase-like domain-containing protein [Crassisporium funariophilum]